jgi:hypothetical protein
MNKKARSSTKNSGQGKTDNFVVSLAMQGSLEALQRTMAEVGTVRPSYRYESSSDPFLDSVKNCRPYLGLQ